jgi:hypothetical protein
MIAKADAEQIEHFAFIPISRTPDGKDGIDFGSTAVELAFEAQAFIAVERMEMIDEVKAGLHRMPVCGGNGAETNELKLAFEQAADLDDLSRRDLEGLFAVTERAALSPTRLFR